jgi:hypothetical protein
MAVRSLVYDHHGATALSLQSMTEVGGCQQRIGLVMASVYCHAISDTDDYSEALTHWALQSSRKKE